MSAIGGAIIIICGIAAALWLIWVFFGAFVQPWLEQLADYLKRGRP